MNDIKYYSYKWLKHNLSFIKDIRKNSSYKKQKNIKYDAQFIRNIKNIYAPVFVLSTGRCGTEYLTKILELSDQIDVYHTPCPELYITSKFAYENFNDNNAILEHVFEAARIELIIESYLRNRIFIETNNKITFLAYAINSTFPNAKFIHLIRHPGDFVRSGIRRKWYMSIDKHDLGRIKPTSTDLNFDNYNEIEKIGWLWNETNCFIENFKKHLGNSNRVKTVKAEELFGNFKMVSSIYDFIEGKLPDKSKFNRIIGKKVNVQKNEDFPRYENWSEQNRKLLKDVCKITDKYNYYLK